MSLVGLVERREELVVVVLGLVAERRQQQLVLSVRRRLLTDVRLLSTVQHLHASRPTVTRSASLSSASVALSLDRIARTTYVGAVYCYRPSSVVCRSVSRSVCVSH